MSADFSQTFRGLKVVELASVLAGPSVGLFFAELGATVIKIENPNSTGDMTRSWKLPVESPENSVSAYFAAVNVGKTFLKLDLNSVSDRAQLDDLLLDADVLLVNFKPGDAERYQLEFRQLSTSFPKLIYGSITGFGPDDSRTAFDIILQAETGYMSMNGEAGSPPTKMPVALIDVLAGHQLKEAILLALWEREKTGKGCAVEVSLRDAAIASLVNQASNYLMAGVVAQRRGSLHPNIAPYGEIFTCADGGQLVIAAATQKQFESLCQFWEKPEWITNALFLDNQLRVENRSQLADLLTPLFKTQHAEQLCQKLNVQGIPTGQIRQLDAVLQEAETLGLTVKSELEGQSVHVVRSFVAQKQKS